MADVAIDGEILAPDDGNALPTDVSGWKIKITSSWKSAAEGILLVSKDLHDARESLKTVDRRLWNELSKQLHDENIISLGIQKKLVVIGERYDTLINVAAYLPPRYNAIYRLSDLKAARLDEFVKDKQLKPTLEDKEIAALLVSEKSAELQAAIEPATRLSVLRIFQTGKRITNANKAALSAAVAQIREISGFEVVLSPKGIELLGEDEG